MSSPAPRHAMRLALGGAAVLSPQQAAELLPWRDGDARAWLVRAGIVRRVDGREVVIWADVLAALRAGDTNIPEPPPKPPARRKGAGLPRRRLP